MFWCASTLGRVLWHKIIFSPEATHPTSHFSTKMSSLHQSHYPFHSIIYFHCSLYVYTSPELISSSGLAGANEMYHKGKGRNEFVKTEFKEIVLHSIGKCREFGSMIAFFVS